MESELGTEKPFGHPWEELLGYINDILREQTTSTLKWAGTPQVQYGQTTNSNQLNSQVTLVRVFPPHLSHTEPPIPPAGSSPLLLTRHHLHLQWSVPEKKAKMLTVTAGNSKQVWTCIYKYLICTHSFLFLTIKLHNTFLGEGWLHRARLAIISW